MGNKINTDSLCLINLAYICYCKISTKYQGDNYIITFPLQSNYPFPRNICQMYLSPNQTITSQIQLA